MIRKVLLLFCLSIILLGCGFTPMYSKTSNINFEITKVEFTGNSQMNNFIENRLNKYSKTSANKKYNLKINTRFQKISVAKDTTGKITNYELQAISSFQINYNKKNVSFTFKEKLNIKNIEDSFEQRKYENVVKNNFASSIQEKLILKLKTIK